MTPDEIALFRRLARRYRFPYRLVTTAPRHHWDGRRGHIIIPASLSDAVHEIGHYLVCSRLDASRLRLPDFGLGPSLDSMENAPRVVRDSSPPEEELASILGILIERAAGARWRCTWLDHGWHDYFRSQAHISYGLWTVRPVLHRLHKLGLYRRGELP